MSRLPNLLAALLASAALGGPTMAEPTFASKAQAMTYLAATLPKASSENPKYTTKRDGTISQWLTDEVSFAAGGDGAVEVTMRERYTQTQGGKTQSSTHEARFSLADVAVEEFTEDGDATPTGAPARGVIFRCAKAGCIAANWGGAPSRADKSDIYIQDEATRAKVLAAFRRLQTA